jgi:hypothetical protein
VSNAREDVAADMSMQPTTKHASGAEVNCSTKLERMIGFSRREEVIHVRVTFKEMMGMSDLPDEQLI